MEYWQVLLRDRKMNESYLSVSQVNNYIKNIFDAEILLQGICVYGEIGSYNVSGGNAYFTLKDENSLINCVMFGARGTAPDIGDTVLAFGSMQYYTKGGRITFNVGRIEPYGKGLLYENFLKLKQKLEGLGYFDPSKKKPIPRYVRRIGVVTSETGAVIQDIRDVTRRRNDTIDIVLYPVKVQGVGAEMEIAKGIDFFSNYDKVDCVIVARGGGSAEDLQAFNTEIVADATYRCKKPLVSAVGHETDFTIIDFVSDLRVPTPSAAAELVAWKKDEVVGDLKDKLNYMLDDLDVMQREKMSDVQHLFTKLQLSSERVINFNEKSISSFANRLNIAIDGRMTEVERSLEVCEKTLCGLNPLSILNRGYAVISRGDEKVDGIAGLCEGESVKITMKDGSMCTEIISIEREI